MILGGFEIILGVMLAASVIALCLLIFGFWIFMLVSAVQNPGLTSGEKTGWVLAIVFFHFIGSLLYLLIGRPKRHTRLAAT